MVRFLPLSIAAFLLAILLNFRGQIKTEIKKWQLSGSTVASELSSQGFVDKILAGNGKFDPSAKTAEWFNQEIPVPSDLANKLANFPEAILGQSTDQKWIDIDLTTQHLYAYEGNRVVFDFPISSGLPWLPTVTGDFRIWAKVRSQRMTGGQVENGTYYDLPNVPFVQYFYKGFGLHGAYWHNDFGRPRSHGCVNISVANAEKLFAWTDPVLGSGELAKYNIDPSIGTRVVVHGTTPTNIY